MVPRDLTRLADADIVFLNGAFFEEGLLDAIENAGEDVMMIEASTCVPFLAFGGHDDHGDEDHDDHGDDDHDDHGDEDHDADCANHYAELDSRLGADWPLSDDDHHVECEMDHNDETGGDEHDHAEGACDPHVWMDPHNVMLWTLTIRDALIAIDPQNESVYATNADAYLGELQILLSDFTDQQIATLPDERRLLLTNHDSLAYFAERFDFEIVDTIAPGVTTLADPSPADIAAAIDVIRDRSVPAIFLDNTVDDRLARLIAAETEAEIVTLYTGSLSDENGPASTYIEYFRYNVSTIVAALSDS